MGNLVSAGAQVMSATDTGFRNTNGRLNKARKHTRQRRPFIHLLVPGEEEALSTASLPLSRRKHFIWSIHFTSGTFYLVHQGSLKSFIPKYFTQV